VAYTFIVKQGASGEAVEDIENDILCEVGQCIPLVGGLLHSLVCIMMRASSIMRSLKRKMTQ
jgi:hypothetical protein